jgi:hypothetical protein
VMVSFTGVERNRSEHTHVLPRKNCSAATTTLVMDDVHAEAITLTVLESVHTLQNRTSEGVRNEMLVWISLGGVLI